MNSKFTKWLYLSVEKIRGEDICKYLSELEKTQWYTSSDLREYQWDKLKKLLDHAYTNVPFYRKAFKERNISPDDIKNTEDLNMLPILTKNDLRKNIKFLLAEHYTSRMSVAKSSGSTGISIKFYKDRNSSAFGRAAMYRGHRWYDLDIGDLEARLWGVPINFNERIVHKIADFFLNRFREINFEMTEEIMMEFYRQIANKRPKYIMGYTSLVFQYAQFLKEKSLDTSFDLKMVKVTAETVFDFHRNLIEDVFRCPIVSEYGAAETGLIAFECPKHSMHLMSECVFLEEKDDILSDGNSEFIITDLNNFSLPIIRYQLGDRGKLSNEICKCGRGLPLIESIQGRTCDIVYKRDGTPVHSSVFSYILKGITGLRGGIKQYKVYQESKGDLRLEIVRDSTYNEDTTRYLKEQICKKLGDDIKIEIDYVGNIGREKYRKLRYFVSHIPEKN